MMADPIAVWSSFLASPEAPRTAMSALELDGYLTGVIVTPQAAAIRPSAWTARLWGADDPVFADEAQISAVFDAVMIQHASARHRPQPEAAGGRSHRRLSATLRKSLPTTPCAHGSAASGKPWGLPPRPGAGSQRTSGPG